MFFKLAVLTFCLALLSCRNSMSISTEKTPSRFVKASCKNGLLKKADCESESTEEDETDLVLSLASVAEKSPLATTIGNLSMTGSGASDTQTFSLIDGTGSDDNAKFSIDSDQLKTAAVLNYELASNFSIRVRATDSSDNSFEKVLNVSATDIAEVWKTAATIETDNTGPVMEGFIRVASNAKGDAIAVWAQSDGTRYNIWANVYTYGSGWSTAQLIETANGGNARYPWVAMDENGLGIAVWTQTEGAGYNVWANIYTPGGGWGNRELIESTNYSVPINGNLQVIFYQTGAAIAVWMQSDGTEDSIWTNRYVTGTGWVGEELLETSNLEMEDSLLASDGNGTAIAVWADSSTNTLASRRFISGSWEAITSAGNIIPVGFPTGLAMSKNGRAVVLSDGIGDEVWANYYIPGTGWGTPIQIDAPGPGGYDAEVAMDANGNAMAAWSQDDGIVNGSIHTSYYTVGSGWATPVIIETYDADGMFNPDVCFDQAGNAVVVWEAEDGPSDYDIWTNRYIKGTGWGTASLIEVDAGLRSRLPEVSCDQGGNATAVWSQNDGTRLNAHAARFE